MGDKKIIIVTRNICYYIVAVKGGQGRAWIERIHYFYKTFILFYCHNHNNYTLYTTNDNYIYDTL